MEEKVYFEFIQVAVGNMKSLSVAINDSDWLRLFEFCKRQALIGVGFSAVEKLHAVGVVCPANIRMRWMALALQIEKRNALLNEQCRKLTEQYGHDGLATCILKGQGNCLNYPEGLRNRRQCGDIDLWAVPMNGRQQEQHETTWCQQADYFGEQQFPSIGQHLSKNNLYPQITQMDTEGCPQADNGIAIAVQTGRNEVEYVEYRGRKAVIEYVRMRHRLVGNNEKPAIRYHHVEAPKMEGTEVEVHFRPCYVHSPLRNLRLQRWFDGHADVCMKNKAQMGFAVPTSSVNVVYQMCHLFSHYFDEGLGLRQLMDYYFALRVWHNDMMECKDLQSQGMWSEGMGTPVMSATEIMAVLRSFGMGKFAGAVMWVIHEAFENEECRMKKQRSAAEGKANEEYSDADEVSEQQLSATGQQLKEISPQADDRSERECPQINREFKNNNYVPWMICEPNAKEGRRLLAEIMQGGNFGQYDTRDAALKRGGMVKHGVWKLKRVMRLVRSYPEEALWEPVFRVYHLIWRGINGG